MVQSSNENNREVVLKFAAKHQDIRAVGIMLKESVGLGLATPPGLSGFVGGRPKPSPIVRLFSFLIDKDQSIALKKADNIIKKFKDNYNQKWLVMMKSKIGLRKNHKEDLNLIKELLNIMHINKLDYTNTFQNLKNNSFNKINFLTEWYEKYKERLELEKTSADSIKKITNYANPMIIPRNHIVEKYIKEAENNQYKNLCNFLEIIKKPYINDNIPEILKKPPNNNEKILETFCGT